MPTTIARFRPAPLVPFDWSPFSVFQLAPSPVRIEENIADQTYVLRAEVPGVDPARDVTITYEAGVLRLRIHRQDVRRDKAHTEFQYGTYDRVVAVPADIDEHSIAATYKDGILEITAKLVPAVDATRTIPVAVEPVGGVTTAPPPAAADPA